MHSCLLICVTVIDIDFFIEPPFIYSSYLKVVMLSQVKDSIYLSHHRVKLAPLSSGHETLAMSVSEEISTIVISSYLMVSNKV